MMFRMMGFDLYCTQVKMNTEVFFSLVISTFWKLKIASEFHSLQSASILEISYYLHFWPPCTVRVHTVIGWILLLLILLLFIYLFCHYSFMQPLGGLHTTLKEPFRAQLKLHCLADHSDIDFNTHHAVWS